MLVKLDRSFADLSIGDLRDHYNIIQRLLHSHQEQKILLYIFPRLADKLVSDPHFGYVNISIVKRISTRTPDYFAAFKFFYRHILLYPNTHNIAPVQSERIMSGFADNVIAIATATPRFYLENGVNDGRLYSALFDTTSKLIEAPRHLVRYRRFHGGGSTLGHAVSDLEENVLVGMSVCDRDGTMSVPPFREYSTGAGMLACCEEKNAVSVDETISHLHPFFRILPTFGWSLENYIGPHLLEEFFLANTDSAVQRPSFVRAFPNFPNLNEIEYKEWFLSNHKRSNQPAETVNAGRSRLELPPSPDRDTLICALSVPNNAVEWVIANHSDTRFSRHIQNAILRDLDNPIYFSALSEMARDFYEIFAADPRMAFA